MKSINEDEMEIAKGMLSSDAKHLIIKFGQQHGLLIFIYNNKIFACFLTTCYIEFLS